MTDPFKSRSLARLKKIRGQIDGVIKMVEEDKYCIDILTQVLALQGALKGVTPLILESHLNTCGGAALNSRDQQKRQKFIDELIRVVGLSRR